MEKKYVYIVIYTSGLHHEETEIDKVFASKELAEKYLAKAINEEKFGYHKLETWQISTSLDDC